MNCDEMIMDSFRKQTHKSFDIIAITNYWLPRSLFENKTRYLTVNKRNQNLLYVFF